MTTKLQLLVAVIFSIFVFNGMTQIDQSSSTIIVKLKDSKAKASNGLIDEDMVNVWMQDDRINKVERIIIRNTNNLIKLTVEANSNEKEVLSALKLNDNVEYAELDVLGGAHGASELVPSDVQYYKQWALHNNGDIPFTTSKSNADIDMEKAWEIEQGDSNVIVAILDSGVKMDHPEFNGRIWVNRAEVPNNGLDDDNNGFIDDVKGWNFADGTNLLTDDTGHGTNITSIIGSNGNNGTGFSGMDWNCKLMILKVLKNDVGYYSWWVNSIYYAVDNGANVINMSLGGETESKALNDAIQYALDHNVVVVVSMGNENTNQISYPSNYPGVIAVGATNPDDTRCKSFFWSKTSGSNYGSHISVVAPGNYIFGLSNKNNLEYDTYFGGTSQSAAYVSGLASLLIAQTPSISNVELKGLIEKTAEDRVGDEGEDVIGKDEFYGNGRINAFKALAVNHDDAFLLSAEDLLIYPNPATSFINLQFPVETESIEVFNALGRKVFEATTTEINRQTITLDEKGVFFVQLNARGQHAAKKVILL